MTLADHIHQLVRPHMTRRPDGKITRQDALLDQLATAIHTNGRDGSATSEPGLPINGRALDLWKTIDTQVRQEELERAGTMRGIPGQIIERWETEQRHNWVSHLEHVTLDLIDQITQLLDPPPKRRKLREPCPACGEQWDYTGDGDREPCLTAGTHDEHGAMLKPADYDVSCSACGAEWRGQSLTWVLQVIADTPIRETTRV